MIKQYAQPCHGVFVSISALLHCSSSNFGVRLISAVFFYHVVGVCIHTADRISLRVTCVKLNVEWICMEKATES